MRFLSILQILLAAHAPISLAFVHPGILHNSTAIQVLISKSKSSEAIWKSSYAAFSSDSYSSSTYTLAGPLAVANATQANPVPQWGNDMKAAYQNAIMFHVTGNKAYATKSIQILDGWASTLKTITGDNAVLRVGIYGSLMVYAAELIRYSSAGWSTTSISTFRTFLTNVLLPVITPAASVHSFNWGQAQARTLMAVGVYLDDNNLYNTGLGWIKGSTVVTNTQCQGVCCIGIEKTVDAAHGQGGESGRDQNHQQLELGTLAEACEIARSQGDTSCYDYASNRLSKGFEFTAVALLSSGTGITWNGAAFADCKDIWWSRSVISQDGLGDPTKWRPIWEMAYAYYHGVRHNTIGNIQKMVQSTRPEGQVFPVYDSVGFGTFLFGLETV